jgi:acid phosphatase type 7
VLVTAIAIGLVAAADAHAWAPTCTIQGTPRNDVLRGTPGRDVICGGRGNDVIYGRGGKDHLYGGPGADRIYGEDRPDALYGGSGSDRLLGGPGVDLLLSLRGGTDRLNGGPARDRASADGTDGSRSVELRYRATPPSDPFLLAAGDIANCRRGEGRVWDTAPLLDLFTYATVAALGDTAYPNGSPARYASCYEPTWGRAKDRTRPAVGNHEYLTPDAAGYFTYFGPLAGELGKGYYSYDLGTWHIIVLNTNDGGGAGDCQFVSCAAGSPQEQWLRADLAASSATCTLAYFHHPRFTASGGHPALDALWVALQEGGADAVLNGHAHYYERFAPQLPDGTADPNGIVQFIVGTGGAKMDDPPPPVPAQNSVVSKLGIRGLLRLRLRAGAYDWNFIPAAGLTFDDSGSASCH